jgi:cytochrome c556
MKHQTKFALAACCAVATLTVALAQAPAPKGGGGPPQLTPQQRAERAVELRQSVMNVQQFSIGASAAMLRNAPFSADTAQKTAMRLKATSGMIADVFKADTSKEQVKTRAKAEIWTDKDGFDAAINGEVQAVAALETAAAGGDKDATLKAVQGVTKACGDCHDKYREKPPQG